MGVFFPLILNLLKDEFPLTEPGAPAALYRPAPVCYNAAQHKIRAGGIAITILKIIVYGITFAVILAFGGTIVALSLAVAPEAAKSGGMARLAVALSGLAVAGGVVYLAEKLFNTGKGVGQMVLELVVERYKQHQLETGRKQGRAEGRAEAQAEARVEARERAREHNRATRAWYERQQAALRDGLPFDEPPPYYDPEAHANGADAG